MQKVGIKVNGRREADAEKEQKRKSALISMNVAGPAPSPMSPMKSLASKPPIMTSRRSSWHGDEKPRLARLVSLEEPKMPETAQPNQMQMQDSRADVNEREGAANPKDEEESASFHQDLHRLGHAIRSLSCRALVSPKDVNITTPAKAIHQQQALSASQNPFDREDAMLETPHGAGLKNPFDEYHGQPHPFDEFQPQKNEPTNPFEEVQSTHNYGQNNPFEETEPTTQQHPLVEGYANHIYNQSNPFDEVINPAQSQEYPPHPVGKNDFIVPSTPETAASSQNPFDSVPSFNSLSDTSQLHVPVHGEKIILVTPSEIDTMFDVPVNGQKMLMTPTSELDTDFDVPLHGSKLYMSPHPSNDHGDESTDEEGDDDSDDEDDAGAMHAKATAQPVATDRFSFC